MGRSAPARGQHSLVAWGLLVGFALGVFELGLAFPRRLDGLGDPLRIALLFLFPLGANAFVGALLGLLAQPLRGAASRAAARVGLLGLAVVAAALDLRALNQVPASQWPFVVAGGVAALVLILARVLRPQATTPILGGAAASVLVGAATLVLFWSAERSPVRAAGPPVTAAPEDAPSVVLLTWDTVRADQLPAWGGGLPMPAFEELAARSVVIDEMIAVAPLTGPSHASILTGRMPPSHGLRSNGSHVIDASAPVLAEQFRDAGYDTAAFVSAYPLKGRFGFDRGFRVYDDRLRSDRLEQLASIGRREFGLLRLAYERFAQHRDVVLPGEELVERTGAWLEDARGPYFLWVHFFEAHGPYDPLPEHLETVDALDPPVPAGFDEATSGEALREYRAELLALDQQLATLMGQLEARDPGLTNTAVCLVADHGQCFGEAGMANTHMPSLHDATQHVPALLALPGAAYAGGRVEQLVSQVDLAATLCELAGLPAPRGHQGVSLLPAARGEPMPERAWFRDGFYMETFQNGLGDDRKQGLRTDSWSYWEWPEQEGRSRLYEAGVAGRDRSEAAADLRAELGVRLGKLRETIPQVLSEGQETAEDRALLDQLGYGGDDADESH